ncbi:efflux RND transporter permease subunit [Rossellomorea vietnamensis]|uniref:Efflux RND transporter permease subunit n=1 Tax=Rossellomorea vietnamensis TaxID=218284 RepID=A0A5D4M0I1_9BACI|nr:efflux RND transporter permease subunit [Rossellomorea vietnamensis]TYR95022.1 efflux RND transporter permease subunit [Rossellomorea vietnamensis]
MRKILEFSLKNNIAIIILSLLVVVAGLVSSNSIKLETYPDVESPTLLVQAVYPNHSSEEVENEVTKPIEESIENVKPYDTLTSTTRDNTTLIQVTYEFGENMDEIDQSIQASIDKINLPEEVELEYKRISASSKPIYKIAFSAESLDELQENVTDELIPQLQNVSGVSDVNISGATTTQLVVEVDKEKSNEYGLTVSEVAEYLEQGNYVLPLGSLENEGNKIPVSLEEQIESAEELKDITIPVTPEQSIPNQSPSLPQQPQNVFIPLDEIAEVKEVEQVNAISRYNGDSALILEVVKNQEGNTAEVVELLKSEVDDFNEKYEYEQFTIIDQGKEVEKSVDSLIKEGGFGALFTVVIILLFLRNFRATIIAILSLPLSILGTIAVLDYFGYTLNIMTLGGMAVAIGRIVDDSIVVIENIFKWLQRKEAYTKREIIYKATKEVIGAVTSSTIATVVVFLPLAFVGGIVGEFFRPFSIAVVTSIILSLLVAFMLIPVLGLLFLKTGVHEGEAGSLQRGYDYLLKKSLSKKWVVIAVALSLLVGSLAMIPSIGKSFLPSGPASALQMDVELPVSTPLTETDELAKGIEAELSDYEKVDYVQVAVGLANNTNQLKQKSSNDYTATFYIQLLEGETVTDHKEPIEEKVEELVKEQYKDSSIRIQEVQQEGPPSGKTIDITLYGENLDQLIDAANKVEDSLLQNENLTNISNTAQQKQTKFRLELTEEAKEQGISQFAVYQQIEEQMNELSIGNMILDDKETEVVVTYDALVSNKSELEKAEIVTPTGVKELADVAAIEEQQIPAAIAHKDTKSAFTISAESIGEEVGQVTETVEKDIAALSLPNGIEWEVGGGQEMMTEGFRDLGQAMMIAIGLVFLTLTITYGGIITPIVILSSIIFVPIGSLGAIMLTGETLSMSVMIGMLMLIGIVVTNAVVMLDRVESNRREGLDLHTSLIEACKSRFRPIIMTALATILALVPLALSQSSSGVISKSLAITVIGGLTTSTLLTLVFTPVLYSLVGKWRKL